MSSKPEDLLYAAFFFIDIVGLSNPVLSTETQRTKIRVLNELIYRCKAFSDFPKEHLVILPTGDGMLIGFKNGLEEPIKLAIELHGKLSEYNKNVTVVEKIETRIGCNVGHVFVVEDIYGNVNLWGPGAILARRVMDIGDSGHILLSNEIVNDLFEISKDYEKQLHLLQNFGIKHGENLLIYSAFGDGFGNSNTPKEKIKVEPTISNNEQSVCEKMIHNIIVKEDNENVRFERYYYFSNQSKDPIYEITVGLIANSEVEFKKILPKIFDEKNHELKISKIISSSSISKKILVKLKTPLFNGDSERMIKMTYDLKLTQNNYEHIFLIDTKRLELNFSHFSNVNLSPKLYHIDNAHGTKHIVDIENKISKGMFTNHGWQVSKGINLKDMIKLEW